MFNSFVVPLLFQFVLFNGTIQRNSNCSHYTMWQLVKYCKKWNSFDYIVDVDGLNNLNNVVVKRIKICENFWMHFNCYNIYTHWSTFKLNDQQISNGLCSINSILMPSLTMHWSIMQQYVAMCNSSDINRMMHKNLFQVQIS